MNALQRIHLPPNLRKLTVGDYKCNYNVLCPLKFDSIGWPKSLKELIITNKEVDLRRWSPPASLARLKLNTLVNSNKNLARRFYQPDLHHPIRLDEISLPPQLEYLHIGDCDRQPRMLPNPTFHLPWPPSLTHLALRYSCDSAESIIQTAQLPSTLTRIDLIARGQSIKIPPTLPTQLRQLFIHGRISHSLSPVDIVPYLPSNLETLGLLASGQRDVTINLPPNSSVFAFPPSLRTLWIPSYQLLNRLGWFRMIDGDSPIRVRLADESSETFKEFRSQEDDEGEMYYL